MARRFVITLLLAILLGASACKPPRAQATIENTPKDSWLEPTTVEVEDQPYVIYFGSGSATIPNQFQPMLTDIAAVLKAQPNWRIDIQGHSDGLENGGYNLDLSKHRAAAVRQVLVDRYHVAPSRLDAVGFGSTITSKARNPEMRAQNRRVEFALVRRPEMQQKRLSVQPAEMISWARGKLQTWTKHAPK